MIMIIITNPLYRSIFICVPSLQSTVSADLDLYIYMNIQIGMCSIDYCIARMCFWYYIYFGIIYYIGIIFSGACS